MTPIYHQSASELSRAIHSKTISSQEVLAAFLSRIHEKNPHINAVVTMDVEGAKRRAKQADEALARGEDWGPFHGLPVTFKDMFETAGMRTTAAFEPLSDYIPKVDAPVVERLHAAGAIIFGKTNMPRLCGDTQCINDMFGTTRNPWHPDFTPGGTSGGDGAAVAAGFSALSVGGDLAGSVRVPAHFCGLYCIKPTEGRVSCRGMIPPLPGSVISARHMASCGPTTRSGEDLRMSMAHTALFSLSGHPVVGLPFATTQEGLPIGLQLVGKRWRDGALLRVAEVVEMVSGGYRPPPETTS